MESYIKGNVRKILYSSDSSMYKIGLFKLRETNISDIESLVGKTITFTGSLNEINSELEYILYGQMVEHPRYGTQFNVSSYEIKEPSDKDGIIMYLSSGMFKGIGEKTAKNLVDVLGENVISIIKEDYKNAVHVKGMNESKAINLSNKLIEFESDQEFVLKLNTLGFSTEESLKIIAKYKVRLFEILGGNIYELVEIIPFAKVDMIFLKNNDERNEIRINALIKHAIRSICYASGDTMATDESVYLFMNKFFKDTLDINTFYLSKDKLLKLGEIIEINSNLILFEFYDAEDYIASKVNYLNKIKTDYEIDLIDIKIKEYEKRHNIKFNSDQTEAIKGSIKNNLFIISGGPGTGKTTIIKAVVEILKSISEGIVEEDFALLAPTGRSAKRLTESVNIPAYTIHKFLKWNKETLSFNVNEENKTKEKIVIVDEVSMVDIFLFASLLKGLRSNVHIILVGDSNQLPSIAPGNVLYDLLESKEINKKYLNLIYRTSEGSYIIDFAIKIRDKSIFEEIKNTNDFSFIQSNDMNIRNYLKKISENAIKNKIDIDNFQVLVPMYKGENGIDNLNIIMQEIFNPKGENKNEIKIGDRIYREQDKVIELVNDVDNNIFNGDIGYIKRINSNHGKPEISIDFMGNTVLFKSNEFDKFSHAYAISIHKSQGSEYDNVVVIIAESFKRMFYNKLIYTAVTRAKKSLKLIGALDNLNKCITTTYSSYRKSNLSNLLMNKK